MLDLGYSLPSPIRGFDSDPASPTRTPMADVTLTSNQPSTSNAPDGNSVEKRKSRKRTRDEKNWIKNVSDLDYHTLSEISCSILNVRYDMLYLYHVSDSTQTIYSRMF